jgi:hypothetical protein
LLDLRAAGIVIPRHAAEEILKVRGEKQIFGALQPALGKSFAEDNRVRMMADVIDLKNQPITGKDNEGTYKAILVCIDCFSRVLYARPLKTKTQEEIKSQLRSIFERAPKPKVISTDNGNEFKGAVSEYLESKGIAQRFRSVGDINALALVDRAIQQLKQKIAEMLSRGDGDNWKDVLSAAVNALNNQRRDVLHGEKPTGVDSPKLGGARTMKCISKVSVPQGPRPQARGRRKQHPKIQDKWFDLLLA